jgi:hypothetical protein
VIPEVRYAMYKIAMHVFDGPDRYDYFKLLRLYGLPSDNLGQKLFTSR